VAWIEKVTAKRNGSAEVREQIPYKWREVAELFSAPFVKIDLPPDRRLELGEATRRQGTRNIFPEYGSFTFWPEVNPVTST
jgi:hypothetical protein